MKVILKGLAINVDYDRQNERSLLGSSHGPVFKGFQLPSDSALDLQAGQPVPSQAGIPEPLTLTQKGHQGRNAQQRPERRALLGSKGA